MSHARIDRRDGELAPLTDSLASCIRWRLSDYEAMLRSEMDLLLDTRPLSQAGQAAARAAANGSQPVRP